MRKITISLSFCFFSFALWAQQWNGPATQTDLITRTGRVGIGGLTLGRYGSGIVSDPNPYFISSDETVHDLLVFGSSEATLHLRLFDGDLKMGPNTTPNAILYNAGNLQLGGTFGDRLVLKGEGLLNIRVGRWASLGETGSGLATIMGSNIKASSTVDNKLEVISTTVDGARAIKMQYNEGITFHTVLGQVNAGSGLSGYERMRIDVNGNVGIGLGSVNPSTRFDIANGPQRIKFLTGTCSSGYELNVGVNDDGVNFFNNSSIRGYRFGNMNGTQLLITANGNVGIGSNPDHKLDVKGFIHAEEVLIDLNVPGPDYVFEESYDLMSLKETEDYIKVNKHLPEVPSAKEMQANGLEVMKMNLLLLKKVEELTLHLIEMEKNSQSQSVEIDKLKEKLKSISK